MMKKTGAYITEKRIKKDILQKELAKELNVPVTQVEKWERGDTLPGILQLEPLCGVLGCNVTQLLQGDDAASADALIMRLLCKVERYPECNHDKLKIGKFCSIACGAKFIFNAANHALGSLST